MRSCTDEKLQNEQDRLFQLWVETDSDEDLYEFGYNRASKELRDYFDRRTAQDEWDKKHRCVTN